MTTIKTRLTKRAYANVSLAITFRKTTMKIYIGIALLLLALAVFESIYLPEASNAYGFIFPIVIVVVRPALVYLGAWATFNNNPRLNENIQYTFHPQTLEITGESFDSRLSWNKIAEITRTKNFLLIYQTKNAANIIPLSDTNELDLAYLKEIAEEHRIKNNL